MKLAGRIDVHGHYLPGVDDGCEKVEESLACALQLVAAGYTHAFCTPHIWPSLKNNVDSIRAGVARLQLQLDERSIPLKLACGAEYNLAAMWPAIRALPKEQLVTCNLRGEFLLFDFWAGSMREVWPKFGEAIAHLKSLGITAILAHPERIDALNESPDEIDRFLEMGVRLQMNTWCLGEPEDSPLFQTAVRLLSQKKYFCFGTDCHDPQTLPERLDGVQIAINLFGKELVHEMTIANPSKLWGMT